MCGGLCKGLGWGEEFEQGIEARENENEGRGVRRGGCRTGMSKLGVRWWGGGCGYTR